MNYTENAHQYITEKLEETSMTQTEFADAVFNMKQSNFSKALNRKDGHDFTLDQYLAIADYFDISLDTLFGRTRKEPQISARSICSWFVELYKTNRVLLKTIDHEEVNALEEYNDEFPKYGKYNAIFFPKYDNNSSRYTNFNDLRALNGDYNRTYNNTDYDNVAINKFISKFLDIYDFKTTKGLPAEAYDIVISTYLNELSAEPYCAPQDFRGEKES